MTAVLLALTASLAWGIADFGGGSAARRQPTLTIMLFLRLGGVATMTVVVLATSAPWLGDRWPFAVGSALAAMGGVFSLLRALAIGPMGVTAPIVAASGAVPAVAGLFGGDAPSGGMLLGLAVAAAGAVIASRAPGHDGERANPTGIAYALAAATLFGVNLLLVHQAAEASAVTAVLVQRITEVLGITLLLLLTRARPAPAPGTVPILLGLGVLEGVALSSYAAASTHGPLTLAAVLSSLYPAVTVLLARAFHHERLARGQAVGAALTLGGVALVVAMSA